MLLFSLRGDSLTPRFARGSKAYSSFLGAGTLAHPPVIADLAHPSVFGGKAIDLRRDIGDTRVLCYSARNNWVRDSLVFSVRARLIPDFSGNPVADMHVARIGDLRGTTPYGGIDFMWQDNSKFRFMAQPKNEIGSLLLTAPDMVLSDGVAQDFMLTSNGTNWFASIEGTEVATGALAGTSSAWLLNDIVAAMICFAQYPSSCYINEFSTWNTCEPHVYTPRTAFLACDDYEGDSHTELLASQVESGVAFGPGPGSQIGSALVADPASVLTDAGGDYIPPDPSIVDSRFNFGPADDLIQGTLPVPSVQNTRFGVATGDGSGLLVVPLASQVAKDVAFDTASVGTLDNVTNVIGNHDLEGAEVDGILEAN
mgnify:CR=1 FL=1